MEIVAMVLHTPADAAKAILEHRLSAARSCLNQFEKRAFDSGFIVTDGSAVFGFTPDGHRGPILLTNEILLGGGSCQQGAFLTFNQPEAEQVAAEIVEQYKRASVTAIHVTVYCRHVIHSLETHIAMIESANATKQ